MIKDIILLQSSILNAKYKTLLVYTNSQLKQYIHYDNKGIKYLLSLLGDPDEIIRDYEQEKEPIPNSMMDFKGDFSKYDDPNQPNEPQGPIRNPLLEKAERAAQHAREINNRSPPKDKGNPSDYYASDFLRTR
jgi:predicted ATP-dependent endonuclease of OLD family